MDEHMRKDLPKLYKGNVLHEVNNNIYYSSLENKENIGKQVHNKYGSSWYGCI